MNGLTWFKSSYSSANGACIECALLPGGGMAVRDSKDATGPAIVMTANQWRTFLTRALLGDLA